MQMILHCTKADMLPSNITRKGVSFDRFEGLEGEELHKSLDLKP